MCESKSKIKDLIIIPIGLILLFLLCLFTLKVFGLINLPRFINLVDENKTISITLNDKMKQNLQKAEETIVIANTTLKSSSIVLSFMSIAFALIVFFGFKQINEVYIIRNKLEREYHESKELRHKIKKEVDIFNKISSAKFLYAQKEYDQAWDLIEPVSNDISYEVPLYKGLINYRQKDILNAISNLEDALKHPDNNEKARTLCDIGNCLFEKEQYEQAIIRYENVITIKSNYLPAYNGKARALKRLGDREGAIKILEKLVLLDKDYESAYYNIACYKSISKKPEEAIDNLKKAIELNKENIGLAKEDKDFDNIRNNQEFKKVIKNS